MKAHSVNRYLLAIIIPAIGPWLPGAVVCQNLWSMEAGMGFLIIASAGVVGGIIETNDSLPRYHYWFILIQFVVFWSSVFLLKYISYLLV